MLAVSQHFRNASLIMQQYQMAAKQQSDEMRSIRTLKKKLSDNLKRKAMMQMREDHSQNNEDFSFRIREEQYMCDRAVQKLKEGSSILIDWTTRSNFRVNPDSLPKLKTQPIYFLKDHLKDNNNGNSIQLKRMELAKLLHEKKKFYLKSKTQQQDQQKLFGIRHNEKLRKSYIDKVRKKLQRSKQRRLSEVKHTIESTQQQLLQNCKLEQLKEDLKLKFQQIRDLYNQSGKPKRNSLLLNL